MKKRLGGLAIAVAAVIGFTSPAAAVPAGPIVITPGYKGVITTNEPTTFEFTGCDGTIEFVLFYFVDGVEVTRFLGSVPGPNGSWTFSSPTPGTFKIIVNCFVDDELDSTDFVFIEVVPPPVDTTLRRHRPRRHPFRRRLPLALAQPRRQSVRRRRRPFRVRPRPAWSARWRLRRRRGASVSGAGALPATGQDNTALLAAAGALLVIGTTLVLVRRRPA